MGIYGQRFYFRQGLPKVRDIKDKFKEITGLRVGYTSDLSLEKLVNNSGDVIYHLNRGRDEVRHIYSEEFQGDKSEVRKDQAYISYSYFCCDGFADVSIGEHTLAEKSFALQCGIRDENHYFFYALIKTMLELGGSEYDYHVYPDDPEEGPDNYLMPYFPHERHWKRIRKWDEMSDLEKAGFKSKYA